MYQSIYCLFLLVKTVANKHHVSTGLHSLYRSITNTVVFGYGFMCKSSVMTTPENPSSFLRISEINTSESDAGRPDGSTFANFM